MRHHTILRSSITKTSLLLGLVAGFISSTTAYAASSQQYSVLSPREASGASTEIQVSQLSNSCYQVIIDPGMYVRTEPTVFSQAIDVLFLGEVVTRSPNSDNPDWFFISEPTPGYVWAEWLVPC